MKKEGYEFILEDEIFYTFLSVGKKEIPKVVIFQKTDNFNYNLVLGDIDIETGLISDKTISNNGDMVKVLTTVFQITLDFLKKHPNYCVTIKGNTEIKNDLYKRLIDNYFNEIRNLIIIKALVNGEIVDYIIGSKSELFYIYAKDL